ncbi:uncharacterized protein TrAtP1_001513 [Trichoderma atroviride]|uniref:uncharacterized protein n=1 Tax=Hypocrea atroviridis TaxID=63577 RepID=UPI00332A9569|nr:hypothetical protein TrAtP1_001513 [Trichoderma atroviride]
MRRNKETRRAREQTLNGTADSAPLCDANQGSQLATNDPSRQMAEQPAMKQCRTASCVTEKKKKKRKKLQQSSLEAEDGYRSLGRGP